jgi:hypothetical protein
LPVIVESSFHINEDEYQRRRAMPWPEDPGTFVPAQFIRNQIALGQRSKTTVSSTPVWSEEVIDAPSASIASQAEQDAIAGLFDKFRRQTSDGHSTTDGGAS